MSTPLASIDAPPRLRAATDAILEARVDPRVGADFPIQLWSSDFSGVLAARARDIGVGGMCVATPSIFSFKSLRRVRLEAGDGSIEMDVEGRWQSESSDDSILTGVRFLNAKKSDVSALWGVVQDASKKLGLFLFEDSDLSGLCADDATNLAECSRYRVVSARRRLFRQDECRSGDDSIFLVLRGELSLMVCLGDRAEITLERLSRGSLFGGLPVIADTPNQESAVADTDVTLLEISAESFSYLRVAKPLLAQRLAQIITRRQLLRSRRLVELASRTF